MRIDSHQHFWKFDPVRHAWIDSSMQNIAKDFLPEDLKPLLETNLMDGCIAVQADQSEIETQFLLRLAEENSFIKGVVGWVDLSAEDLSKRLEVFSKNPLFKGVRHVLQAEKEGFMLKDQFLRGISELKNFNLTYDILIYPNQLEEARLLIEKNPDQPFVLDHLAKPYIKQQKIKNWASDIKELAKYKNVYCKLSGMVTEADWNHWQFENFKKYLSVAFDTFGSDRLMFGSDWPVCLLAGSYEHVVKIIDLFIENLEQEEKNNIMGGNACNFYNL
ncbi:MAG: amidohydrolase family protein [Bacteroidota bacterium]|nr:amidohydrolase family protein [Bacteroidota bacterium]MEC8402340.1 amidohydrolase family protein [Bacteroidota bacterium]